MALSRIATTLLVVIALASAPPEGLDAQADDRSQGDAGHVQNQASTGHDQDGAGHDQDGAAHQDQTSARRWYNLGSVPAAEDRLVWGMWSTHINRANDPWKNVHALALIYSGFYAASFQTTHGPRAYTLGVERTWARTGGDTVVGKVGFRSGLVYGYDGRLGWMADRFPVLPFIQPVLYGRVGPFTADIAYTWVVVSVSAGLRF